MAQNNKEIREHLITVGELLLNGRSSKEIAYCELDFLYSLNDLITHDIHKLK